MVEKVIFLFICTVETVVDRKISICLITDVVVFFPDISAVGYTVICG